MTWRRPAWRRLGGHHLSHPHDLRRHQLGLEPETDGRLRHFKTAKVVSFERAGHWVHHDRFDAFIATLRDFL